jgi:membrane-associated phospholipid phosphatase
MFPFDPALSLALNGFFATHTFLTATATFLAETLQYGILMGLCAYVLYGVRTALWARARYVLYSLGISAFVRLVLVKPLLVYLYPLARPYVALHDIVLLGSQQLGEEMQSFPSGHALFFFALATVMYIHNKKAGTILYVGAALMAFGRVAAGLHYTSDVVVGALLGSAAAYGTVFIVHKMLPTKLVKLVHLDTK